MKSAEIPYTTPRLVKGKSVDVVLKDSPQAKEEAKQSWYIQFFYLSEVNQAN